MSDTPAPTPPAPRRGRQTPPSASGGLLPPASELEAYERLVPGIAERLLGRWEQQIEHRQAMERLRIESERLGLTYGLRIAMAFLIVSALIILAGIVTHQWVGTVTGGVLGGIDLVALVYVFVAGRAAVPPRSQRKTPPET